MSIGAIFALSTSLLGAMFPLPRVLYAMSTDGLLYQVFKVVNVKTKTPVFSTMLSGVFAAVMSLIFDTEQLIDMMSIGEYYYTFTFYFYFQDGYSIPVCYFKNFKLKSSLLLFEIFEWHCTNRCLQKQKPKKSQYFD